MGAVSDHYSAAAVCAGRLCVYECECVSLELYWVFVVFFRPSGALAAVETVVSAGSVSPIGPRYCCQRQEQFQQLLQFVEDCYSVVG